MVERVIDWEALEAKTTAAGGTPPYRRVVTDRFAYVIPECDLPEELTPEDLGSTGP